MYPAGRQILPVVAFQRRMRPSFPAEDKTVLIYHKQRNSKGKWGVLTPWCSTLPSTPRICHGYVSDEENCSKRDQNAALVIVEIPYDTPRPLWLF